MKINRRTLTALILTLSISACAAPASASAMQVKTNDIIQKNQALQYQVKADLSDEDIIAIISSMLNTESDPGPQKLTIVEENSAEADIIIVKDSVKIDVDSDSKKLGASSDRLECTVTQNNDDDIVARTRAARDSIEIPGITSDIIIGSQQSPQQINTQNLFKDILSQSSSVSTVSDTLKLLRE